MPGHVLSMGLARTAPPGEHTLRPTAPIPWFAALVRNGVNLWPVHPVFLIHERVRKTVEVLEAEATVSVWGSLLVLDDEVANPLVLGKKRFGNGGTGFGGVVNRGIAKLSLGIRMNPMGHGMRARTRTSASSPGTMATLPALTSAWRRSARSSHARCADDCGSKLAIRRSRRRALSSGGRPRTSTSRSCTGVDMAAPVGALSARMPHWANRGWGLLRGPEIGAG